MPEVLFSGEEKITRGTLGTITKNSTGNVSKTISIFSPISAMEGAVRVCGDSVLRCFWCGIAVLQD